MNETTKEPKVFAVFDDRGKLVGIKAAEKGPIARKMVKGGKRTRPFGPLSNLTK